MKRIYHLMDFEIEQGEIKRKLKDNQILRACLRTEKALEHKIKNNPNFILCTENGIQEPGAETGRTRNQWENRNHPKILLKLARLLRRVLEALGDLLSLRL